MSRNDAITDQQKLNSVKKPDSEDKNPGSKFKKILEQVFPNELTYNYDEPVYLIRWSMVKEAVFTAISYGISPTYDGSDTFYNFSRQVKQHIKEQMDNSSGPFSTSQEQIIIAESGVTAELNIRSLTMETVADTTSLNPKTPVTKFTMELFEPYGCSLYDQLHYTSLMLGVNEWRKGFCNVLELTFKGRNRTTGEFETCKFANTEKAIWRWRFCITGLEGKVDEGGTTYTITGVPVADYALDKQKFQLPMIYNNTANSVGALFKNLQLKLNEWYKQQRAKGTALPDDSFEFRFPIPELYRRKITEQGFNVPANPMDFKIDSKPTNSSRKKPFGFKSGCQATWGEGTTFDQILKDIQVATPHMQHLLHGKDPSASGPTNPKDDRDKIVKFDFKIFPETVIKSYDPILREYNRHYIYYITPVVAFKPIVDEDKPNDRKDKDHQQKRFECISSINAVRKKYSYIYTGENQDLMSFDINLNFMHFAQIPKASPSYSTQDAGIVNTMTSAKERNKDSLKPADAKKQEQKRIEQMKKDAASVNIRDAVAKNMVTTTNVQNKGELVGTLQKLTKNKKAGESATATLVMMGNSGWGAKDNYQKMMETRAQLNDILGKLDKSDSDARNTLAAYNEEISRAIAEESNRRSQELTKNLSNVGLLGGYSADMKYKDVKALLLSTLEQNKDLMNKNDIIKVTTIADIEDLASDATGAPVDEPYSQSLTSAILKQAENSAQNLIDISIEVRGDPYWLGFRDDTTIDPFMENPTAGESGNMSIINTMMFALEFRFPEQYNEETGIMEFNDQNIFKGIYSVTNITNKFSDGAFVQDLKAYRELLTDITEEYLGE